MFSICISDWNKSEFRILINKLIKIHKMSFKIFLSQNFTKMYVSVTGW